VSGKCVALISLAPAAGGGDLKLTVNTEKMVIGSMLFKQIKEALM
jgi:hypothetical protein